MVSLKLTFLGSGSEVGRSSILLENEGEKHLLDCGVKVSSGNEYPLISEELASSLKSVYLTHAHLDHSGFLPKLPKLGFKGKIICTKPTRDLIQVLLNDFVRITPEKIYSHEDVTKMLSETSLVDYGDMFYDAGHILGSASIKINDLLYSGDINNRSSTLLDKFNPPKEAKHLILEGTYSANKDKFASQKTIVKNFIKSINDTLEAGGIVLIPSFGIGRGQELLFVLDNHMKNGVLKKVPIFVDGSINKVLRIYRSNANYLNDEIKNRILTSVKDPFQSENYFKPKTRTKSDVYAAKPCIVLSTSGMLNGGPILSYLKKCCHDEKNKIILVGFQPENSKGRKLLEEKKFSFESGTVDMKLQVEQHHFSAHADQPGLYEYVNSIQGLETVILNHGESKKLHEFQEFLKDKTGLKVIIPENGESIKLS
ncbi:Ribonuclease BN [uncultured archaeon]|nr:Ribonuclease BN [uncultured archaeon]